MKELAPAHQHYPRDFCVETLNMTPEACGIYVWLRGACWMDGSITANISDLARACKTNPKAMARAWSQMDHLFEKKGDRLIHPGMETIRKQQEIYREKKSHAGKVGAGSRWQSHNSRISDARQKHATSITNDSSASASASANRTIPTARIEVLSEYPKAAAVIRSHYQTVDEPMVQSIVQSGIQAWLSVESPKIGTPDDGMIAEALKICWDETSSKQTSPALFRSTLPRLIKNWAQHGKENGHKPAWQIAEESGPDARKR